MQLYDLIAEAAFCEKEIGKLYLCMICKIILEDSGEYKYSSRLRAL